MKEKTYLKVPTSVIRNDNFDITADEFLLYARLCYLYFRSYQNKEFTIDTVKHRTYLKIADNRTLKNRLNKLYRCGLIENQITKLPRNGQLTIVFNDELYNGEGNFTLISSEIFQYYKEGGINSHSFRLLMYYKSHINRNNNKHFCYAGYRTIAAKLKSSCTTILESNEELKKNKLIKVVMHKLENTYEYDDADELVFDRYNNHYYVSEFLH